MSLLTILRTGVRIIDNVTKDLQGDVIYERAIIDPSGYGRGFEAAVTMKAIVDWRQKQVRTLAGVLSTSRATVIFLDIDEMVAATAGEGISDHDKITLPDGTTGPILNMSGFIDAGTTHPIATEVFLG